MLEIFYQSVVTSVLFFAVVCWGSSIGASDTNRLNKLIRKARLCDWLQTGHSGGCGGEEDTEKTVVHLG